jgi:hypothetical protein
VPKSRASGSSGLHPLGFTSTRRRWQCCAPQPPLVSAGGHVESQSADRVCCDGLRVAREARGARRGDPRCHVHPLALVPPKTGQASTRKSPTRSSVLKPANHPGLPGDPESVPVTGPLHRGGAAAGQTAITVSRSQRCDVLPKWRGSAERAHADIPLAELASLAKQARADGVAGEDVVRATQEHFRLGRRASSTRQRFEEAAELASRGGGRSTGSTATG